MYIPEFWCGVIATVGVELITFIVWGITAIVKENKKGE